MERNQEPNLPSRFHLSQALSSLVILACCRISALPEGRGTFPREGVLGSTPHLEKLW